MKVYIRPHYLSLPKVSNSISTGRHYYSWWEYKVCLCPPGRYDKELNSLRVK